MRNILMSSVIFLGVGFSAIAFAYDHPGTIQVMGAMNDKKVFEIMEERAPKVAECYETHVRKTNRSAQGKLTAEFIVDPKPSALSAKASSLTLHVDEALKNKKMEKCVTAVLANIEFPNPKLQTKVLSPFTLFPKR